MGDEMKINDTLRKAVIRRRLETTKIADLTVAEFRTVMEECLQAHDARVEALKQAAGLSTGYNQFLMRNAEWKQRA